MRSLFLILLASLLLTGITPTNNAWSIEGIDLFCFRPHPVEQPAEVVTPLQMSWLRNLLLRPSRKQLREKPTQNQSTTSLALRLDERTRFGLSAAPATPGADKETDDDGPAFHFGLQCLLD